MSQTHKVYILEEKEKGRKEGREWLTITLPPILGAKRGLETGLPASGLNGVEGDTERLLFLSFLSFFEEEAVMTCF
jgi:hypothetical protein